MNGAVYPGLVQHNRPGKHRLRYRVFMLAVDIDELESLNGGFRLLKHNKPALMSIYDRDHADRIDAPLRPQIEAKLREAGIECADVRIVLLTMPRLFGYVFNPLSVYFCYGRDGSLVALVHQVANTFGERHFYVLAPTAAADGKIAQTCDKAFFVSPFLEMDLSYEFEVTPPGERAVVSMLVRRDREVALVASFAGDRRDLTDAALLRVWLSNPLMTFAVIAGIHWEALKMWTKGVRYLGRKSPPRLARHSSAFYGGTGREAVAGGERRRPPPPDRSAHRYLPRKRRRRGLRH